MRDFFAQFYYRYKVPYFEWKEQKWVREQFYHDAAFKALDEELLDSPNPFHIAKVFPYGETPLRVLYQMAKAAGLKPTDHFVDLGCGRGRAVFFLSHFFGCKATGIDLTASFIARAKKLAKNHRIENVSFICQDFMNYDFKDATCVYLYNSTHSDVLQNRLRNLPVGSRVISVSEPLELKWDQVEEVTGQFPWGQGTLYLHGRTSNNQPASVLVQ